MSKCEIIATFWLPLIKRKFTFNLLPFINFIFVYLLSPRILYIAPRLYLAHALSPMATLKAIFIHVIHISSVPVIRARQTFTSIWLCLGCPLHDGSVICQTREVAHAVIYIVIWSLGRLCVYVLICSSKVSKYFNERDDTL